MTTLSLLFAAAVTVAGLLGAIGIAAPRRLALKGTALATTIVFLPLAYGSMAGLLGKPKPTGLAWWSDNGAEATVLASRIEEDEAIYLWLQLPDVSEPRAYVLPWNRDAAEELQDAEREAQENGTQLKMRLPFEPSLEDRERKFYALPQPALPRKPHPGPGPEVFEPRGQEA